MSLADELAKLKELHDAGALTDAEYAGAKEQLLGGGKAVAEAEPADTAPSPTAESSADVPVEPASDSTSSLHGGTTAAAPGGAAVPVATPATRPATQRSKRGLWIGITAACIVLIGGLVTALVLLAGSGAPDEVFLDAAAEVGSDPFTEPLSSSTVTTGPVSGSSTSSTTTSPSEQQAGTSSGGAGSARGPFGGTGDDSLCDRELLIDFLTDPDNVDQALAFAGVFEISVSTITSFVQELTPTTLTADVRVTNHRFTDGRAVAFQSVLQAGTAVLVDPYGVPTVRCRCGNPLLEPVRTRSPEYVGTRWPGFDPANVVVITQSTTIIFPPGGPADTTTTTRPDASSTTSVPPTPSGDDADTAVDLVIDALASCVSSAFGSFDATALEQLRDSAQAESTGFDDVYRVTIVAAETASWTVNVATGTINPADQFTAEASAECPQLDSG